MALKKAMASTLTALALAGSAAGTAVAADDDNAKFQNNTQVLSCDIIEVVNIPIISADNNNLDCSKNVKEQKETKVHVVDDSDEHAEANIFAKNVQHEYR
ncbi:hypothetical protein SUDANB6_04129 [Streptomyces sp. enrichment culture]|uniref:hypothetical protein n=1 Tax=Streptomyces sp. enrichment culture TaxID=1795815 RepID=UPI003F56DFE7